MSRSVTSIIAGTPVEGATGVRITSTNPARTSEIIADVSLGDASTFVAATQAARQAQPAWADVPAPVRGRAIAHIGRVVEANAESLARLVTREIGKPYAEALGEVREIVDTCDFFLGEGRRLYGQTVPSEMPDKQLFTFRNPVGVVSVITAGNFPVAVPSWYLIPALLCGNAVVWKPADYSPACGAALFDLLVRGGGLPAGVLNLVLADGEATFAGLARALEEGLVDKVGFTGSSAVGSRIGELTGRHLQSACLELGGKNPMVVTPSAELDLAVEAALFSGFGTAGQRCTSLGTVIVHESVHDDFIARFDKATRQATIGDPFSDVVFGPMLDEKFAQRFEDFLGWIQPHHSVLGSTATGRITAANPREGFVRRSGCRDLLPPDDRRRRARGRCDLPQRDVRPARRRHDLPRPRRGDPARQCPWLRTFVVDLHERAAEVFAFRRGISAGMVSVNNSTSGAEAHLPFGGNGKSGNGSRQSGMWVLDQFTRWQSMNWDYSGRLQKAQMDVTELTPDESFRLAD